MPVSISILRFAFYLTMETELVAETLIFGILYLDQKMD
jgi:hypothetical protein